MATYPKLIFLLILISCIGCKKKVVPDEVTPTPTTYDKLIGKWGLSYECTRKDSNGITLNIDTNYIGLASDYIEFKPNDTVYAKVGGSIAKSHFTVINNDSLFMFNQKRKIDLLNDSSLIYSFGYSKVGNYDMSYVDYLKK